MQLPEQIDLTEESRRISQFSRPYDILAKYNYWKSTKTKNWHKTMSIFLIDVISFGNSNIKKLMQIKIYSNFESKFSCIWVCILIAWVISFEDATVTG